MGDLSGGPSGTEDELTGRNVEVLWEGSAQWYRGQVCAQLPDRRGRRLVQYYDDRSMYFEEISGSESGQSNRMLPRTTYILSTADDGINAGDYCKLQSKCHLFSEISVENAEMMKKTPLKNVIFNRQMASILQLQYTSKHPPPHFMIPHILTEMRRREFEGCCGQGR